MWRTTKRSYRAGGKDCHFNPRPPCGGRPKRTLLTRLCMHISIHVPRVEDDDFLLYAQDENIGFQSTSPVWRTTPEYCKMFDAHIISIHVPRVEDDFSAQSRRYHVKISIHVPRVEDDAAFSRFFPPTSLFQSTSPVWRTTRAHRKPTTWRKHFNPRPPCGGRRDSGGGERKSFYFNPRPPCGGRLPTSSVTSARRFISIHVPRVEDDYVISSGLSLHLKFQSTSPVWRTT